MPRIADPADPAPRFELCAATLLQNREADDGGAQFARHWVMRVAYAFSTALISVFPHVGQGEAYSALIGTVLRRLGSRDPEAMARIAAALGIGERAGVRRARAHRGQDGSGVPLARHADAALGARASTRERLPQVLEHSLRNFNADPKREFVGARALRTC